MLKRYAARKILMKPLSRGQIPVTQFPVFNSAISKIATGDFSFLNIIQHSWLLGMNHFSVSSVQVSSFKVWLHKGCTTSYTYTPAHCRYKWSLIQKTNQEISLKKRVWMEIITVKANRKMSNLTLGIRFCWCRRREKKDFVTETPLFSLYSHTYTPYIYIYICIYRYPYTWASIKA